jgi:cytidine deaminase
MKAYKLEAVLHIYEMAELSEEDRELVETAKQAANSSYAPYSKFRVGAAARLQNGVVVVGANQENAAFPAGLCAERSAIFAAGAQHPDQQIVAIAIAARGTDGELTEEPVSPCGTCRQVMIETETRFNQAMRILLYGRKKVYVVEGIRTLMPLSFTEF